MQAKQAGQPRPGRPTPTPALGELKSQIDARERNVPNWVEIFEVPRSTYNSRSPELIDPPGINRNGINIPKIGHRALNERSFLYDSSTRSVCIKVYKMDPLTNKLTDALIGELNYVIK